jgi:hypothetical protein
MSVSWAILNWLRYLTGLGGDWINHKMQMTEDHERLLVSVQIYVL